MSEARQDLHVAVLGGGPGGYAAAFKAADLGMRVTLVDGEKNPGGVCLYRGCIPSKALLHVARLVHEARHAAAWGLTYGEPTLDLDKLRAFKNGVVGKLTGGLGQLCKARKIRQVQGRAEFVNGRSLLVHLPNDSEERISADAIILASGSLPTRIPAFEIGSARVMDSTSALELPDVPRRLLVVGGGYIGLELGTVYQALGSEVSVVEMTPGLLPGADRDLVEVLQKELQRRFAKIMLQTRVESLVAEGETIRAKFKATSGESSEEVYDRVLVAVGRRPNTRDLGLDKTAIKLTPQGFVEVDAQRRTAEPTVYAIGDVAGEPMLAHKAEHEAVAAVEAIAGKRAGFAPLAIPAVVFTDPEVAWVGLTERQAEAAGQAVKVLRFPWMASGRAVTLDRVDGLTKLLVDPDTDRVLGLGLVGVGVGEMIAEGALAIEMGCVAQDLALTIHPHPTLSETVMEAGELSHGSSVHLYRPPRKGG